MRRQWWILAAIVILLHALAQWLGGRVPHGIAPLGVASVATGILIFLWVLSWAGWEDEPMPKEARIRAAIAGGIVAQYLSLVATATFFGETSKDTDDMSDITDAFVTSFTAVVTVVIAFYFSVSAYVQGRSARPDRKGEGKIQSQEGEQNPIAGE